MPWTCRTRASVSPPSPAPTIAIEVFMLHNVPFYLDQNRVSSLSECLGLLGLSQYPGEQAVFRLAKVLHHRRTRQVEPSCELIRVYPLGHVKVAEPVGHNEYPALLLGKAVKERVLGEVSVGQQDHPVAQTPPLRPVKDGFHLPLISDEAEPDPSVPELQGT